MGNYSEGSFVGNDGVTYPVPNNGTRGRSTLKRWYQCSSCPFDYRADQIRWYEGRPYGISCGCYRAAINDDLSKE